ncbi:MAG: DUF134 domain-containing protein [Clostridia bacterium]|nr:DUF134 domain-containing protein [Clostridia bacterium]
MARPTKWRKIEYVPTSIRFTPDGNQDFSENVLKLEEIEAIRLKDLEGLEQNECAMKMEVSRPTFQRILIDARMKIADSIINGKSISIAGGNFTRNICQATCTNCKSDWNESYENFIAVKNGTYQCPKCGSNEVVCKKKAKGQFCKGNCNRNGQSNS